MRKSNEAGEGKIPSDPAEAFIHEEQRILKKDLRNMTPEELEELALSMGQKKYRGVQLLEWIYKGTTDFREMKNLPGIFLSDLERECTLGSLTVLRCQISKKDGTRKYLFGLPDGNAVESVFMKYRYGNSVCISSQAGCRMGCAFCASGIDGLVRGLTAGEMVSQVLDVARETGEPVRHVVVMGTGEPFDNYDELARFLRILHAERGAGFSWRNITVSTCGLIPGIRRFSKEFPEVGLAVSLHAPSDEIRRRIMPVANAYPIGDLLEACRDYTEKTHRRITFEYALIRGVNDSSGDIEALAGILRGMLCHVNLIPLNEVRETGLATSGVRGARRAAEILERAGIPVTVRRQLGSDIDGACGQLRRSGTGRFV
ncbi:MAG: 23S rRNA (adenine(2503)-C(2))-methyltransferase RlmN [Anaerovoracaceae bacterium]